MFPNGIDCHYERVNLIVSRRPTRAESYPNVFAVHFLPKFKTKVLSQ